jgi:hypothetical protein
MSIHVPDCACLDCGYPFNKATMIERERRPKPRDITVCLNCGHIMAYDTDLRVRALTPQEEIKVAELPELLMVKRFREAYQRAKKESETG